MIKPILFSTPMVQAIFRGEKTQTRRICKKQPLINFDENTIDNIPNVDDAPYKVGDTLWVRETFFDCSQFKDAELFREVDGDYVYKADYSFIGCHKWKPSIFMPLHAARVYLEVTAVRVEPLQSISQQDAIAEGIWRDVGKALFDGNHQRYKIYHHEAFDKRIYTSLPIESYKSLWQEINGQRSWHENPRVFIYEFRTLSALESIEQRRIALLDHYRKIYHLYIKKGFGGYLHYTGMIVDRRKHSGAIPMKCNPDMGIPEPRNID